MHLWVLLVLLLPWTQGGTHALSAVIHACISPSQRCKLGPVSSEPVELCSKLKLKHKPACELLVRDLVDSRIEPARANKRMRIASHCLHYLLFQNVRSPSHRWRKSSRRREPQPERPFFIFHFYTHGLIMCSSARIEQHILVRDLAVSKVLSPGS